MSAEKQANSQVVDGMEQALRQPGLARAPHSSGQAERLMYSVARELQAGSGPGSDYNVVILASQSRMPKGVQPYDRGWSQGLARDSISPTSAASSGMRTSPSRRAAVVPSSVLIVANRIGRL